MPQSYHRRPRAQRRAAAQSQNVQVVLLRSITSVATPRNGTMHLRRSKASVLGVSQAVIYSSATDKEERVAQIEAVRYFADKRSVRY